MSSSVKNFSGISAFIITLVTLLFASTVVLAHDFWVESDSYNPVVGERVEIRLREGVEFKGDTLPYIPEWFQDFSVVDSDGRSPVVSRMGDDPAAILTAQEGAILVGYRSNRSYVELDAAKFNSYLVKHIRDVKTVIKNILPKFFIVTFLCLFSYKTCKKITLPH